MTTPPNAPAPLPPNVTGVMRPADLDIALDWAAKEGWNPGLEDAPAFLGTDPEGFFSTSAGGNQVAAISVVNHTDSFAFLGLYLCHPGWRGQGLGLALWRHALAHAGGRTVGLDGVAAQEANYAKEGFDRSGATHRFEGAIAAEPCAQVRPVADGEWEALIALDAEANGYAKPAFLEPWLQDTRTRKTLVLEDDGEIAAFATIRRCRTGAKIGPLVARDTGAAVILLRACAATAPERPLIVDVPDRWTDLMEQCRASDMISAFSTARMYRGPAPVPGRWKATPATLELG